MWVLWSICSYLWSLEWSDDLSWLFPTFLCVAEQTHNQQWLRERTSGGQFEGSLSRLVTFHFGVCQHCLFYFICWVRVACVHIRRYLVWGNFSPWVIQIFRVMCGHMLDLGKIQKAIGPHEDLLAFVKRCKLQWYGHVSRSSGLAKTILWGIVRGGRRPGRQRKRWEDNIREWTGLEFAKSQRVWRTQKN